MERLVNENKTELFGLFSQQITCIPVDDGEEIYTAHRKMVLCSPAHSDLTNLSIYSHKEAGTLLLLHVSNAVKEGCNKVTIRALATDIVVLAMAMFWKIEWLWNVDCSWYRHLFKIGFMKRPTSWIQVPVPLSYCSMHLRDVTKCQHLLEQERKLYGRLGRLSLKWLRPSMSVCRCQVIRELSKSLLEHFVVLYNRMSDTREVNEARK